MNRIYIQEAQIKNGKKQGAKNYLDYYWCKGCEKIYPVKFYTNLIVEKNAEILEGLTF